LHCGKAAVVLVGGWIFAGIGHSTVTVVNLYSIFVSVLGAILVLVVYHALSGAGPQNDLVLTRFSIASICSGSRKIPVWLAGARTVRVPDRCGLHKGRIAHPLVQEASSTV
jgi:hypothetical protein